MSRFFVGQRVRIVACFRPENRTYIGSEQRIVKLPEDGFAVLDCHPLQNGCNCINLAYLEPILDQKHECCDEDFKRDLDRMLDKEEVR